jgi:nitrate reductase gamma subunit
MQFGKIHGLALATLGIILLGLQVMFFMTPNNVTRGATESSMPKVERKTIPVAGIFGLLSLVAGAGIFVTRRNADEPEKQYAVK